MALTFSGRLSHALRLRLRVHVSVRTPKILLPSVWPLPLSLATTRRISVDFSSSGYLDVSVPRVPRAYLWIHYTLRDSSSRGFPHSEICGSILIYSSPQLIAVSHVLLRLPVPRHSPYALFRLNSLSLVLFIAWASFTVNCLGCFLSLQIKSFLCFLPPCDGKIAVFPLYLERPLKNLIS